MRILPGEVTSQMNFSHDTELTLRAACGLINTDRVDGEQLADQQGLDEYLAPGAGPAAATATTTNWPQCSGCANGSAGSGTSPTTRNALVGQVNALLSDTRAAPWLTRHAEMPEWHLHLASNHDPLAQRMGAEMAMALADLIRAGELRRLKICAAPDCEAVLLDLSRNRSRIFCDTGNCGNRQHVAAYRERRAHGSQ